MHILFDNYYVKIPTHLAMQAYCSCKNTTSLLVHKQQLSRFTISALCASEMVIILHIKQHEMLEKTPLGLKFYECLHEISWT